MSFIPPSYIPNKNLNSGFSLTGTTTRTALTSFVIKAGSMGLNDCLMVWFQTTTTNNANNKTVELEFGSTNFYSLTGASSAGRTGLKFILNRNSLTSQVSGRLASDNDYGASASAIITMAENTNNDITVTAYGTLTNTGDTITLDSLTPYLMKAPM